MSMEDDYAVFGKEKFMHMVAQIKDMINMGLIEDIDKCEAGEMTEKEMFAKYIRGENNGRK